MRATINHSVTFSSETPNGTMFVTVIEDSDGKANEILIHAGKHGSALFAWAHALAKSLSLALQSGATIEQLITNISNLTSDKSRINSRGARVSSGVEGVAFALMEYKSLIALRNKK